MSSSNRKKQSSSTVILILLLMGLASAITFFVMRWTNEKKTTEILETKDAEIGKMTKDMEKLAQRLDVKIKEAKQLGSDYKSLEAYKIQLESDIESLKKEVNLSNTQVKQYLQKIMSYEQMLAAKDRELTVLKEQNTELSTEVDSLSTENDSLKVNSDELEDVLAEVEENNTKLSALAGTLKAENILISAYNKRDKKESKNVFRANRIDKLTIDFTVAENQITEAGNKGIYFRLLEPSGALVYNVATGGGEFSVDGNQAKYTMKKQILYDNAQQKVQFVYERPDDYGFDAGKYIIELYSEGKQIGYKIFEVK